MAEQTTEGTDLFVEPTTEPSVDDDYYGHLSLGQCSVIRRAVKDGGEDQIDIQAEKYGVERKHIERVLEKRPYQRRPKEEIPDDIEIPEISDEELLVDAGVEQIYSTNDVADFFDRSNQWLYWGLREGIFVYEDGTLINPERVGDPDLGRRRFTLPIIKEILLSSYRRGNITPEELKKVLRRIRIAQLGGNWKAREGWTGRQLDRSESATGTG